MDVLLSVQSTPNPNALKFIVNQPVKTEGKVTYKSAEDCHANPLARKIFSLAHVSEVFFFDNMITVTHDGQGNWDDLMEKVKLVILENIEAHDPNFKIEETKKRLAPLTPDITKIEEILDRTIRPALQYDGGDLQVVSFERNVLTVNYQGACGSCPSSTMGTLKAIEGILKDEFNPDIVVQTL